MARSQFREHEIHSKRGVGRPKLYAEQIRVPLAAGTLERLAAVATREEGGKVGLVRAAIERELRRRQSGR